jgi:hypothetical protein
MCPRAAAKASSSPWAAWQLSITIRMPPNAHEIRASEVRAW